ncbi:hypothetical protein LRY60_00850 [Candidatus Woesebacteria bacterium]|nr:hypothetical protein [Candidatus Woesebacteria bacterium]MCD8506831.1 hypothetical protein [Candidatus Woesebacteria bacterium]MCD8546291.1 hypothetical protein [Candidatus Woesebacteria bacterium]
MKLGTHKILWPDFLLGAIGVLSLLGQFGRITTTLGQISLFEIGMAVFILFMAKRKTFWETLFSSKIWWGVSLWWLWTLALSLFYMWPLNVSSDWQSLAYLLRIALFLTFAASVSVWKTSRWRVHSITRLLSVWFTAWAALGIGQYLFLPDTRILATLGWDDHLSRAFATLFEPTFYGVLMSLASVWFFQLGVRVKRKQQLVYAILFAVALIAMSLSFSRLAYVGYVAGIGALALAQKQRRVLLAIPILVVALVLLPKDGGGAGQNLLRTQSITQRVEHTAYQTHDWQVTEMLLGRGWNLEAFAEKRNAAFQKQYGEHPELNKANNARMVDNQYLQIVLTSGGVGAGILLGTLFFLWKNSSRRQWPYWCVLAVAGMGAPVIFYPWIVLASIFIVSEHDSKVFVP